MDLTNYPNLLMVLVERLTLLPGPLDGFIVGADEPARKIRVTFECRGRPHHFELSTLLERDLERGGTSVRAVRATIDHLLLQPAGAR